MFNPLLQFRQRTINKTKLQPESGQVIWVLLIILWFLSAYDRTGTIVGLDLQLFDKSLCPTFCFQAYCRKQYAQANRQTNQPANKHAECLSKIGGIHNGISVWHDFCLPCDNGNKNNNISKYLGRTVAIAHIIQAEKIKVNLKGGFS